jgi:hypothetical protein
MMNGINLKIMNKLDKLTIDKVDKFLKELSEVKNVGIRRKLLAMKKFLEKETILLDKNESNTNI